jgi:hypothetical protein
VVEHVAARAVVMQHVAAVRHATVLRAWWRYENRDYRIQESESEDFFLAMRDERK